MNIRTKEDVDKENVSLRHQVKMFKLKYEMANNALKQITLLGKKELEDFETRSKRRQTNNKLGGANGHN